MSFGLASRRLFLLLAKVFCRRKATPWFDAADLALWEPLSKIGLERAAIARLAAKYPVRLLQEWADITAAARERFGDSFFTRSPRAYFVHNVHEAASGTRTPPDWWHQVRKEELRRPNLRRAVAG